MADSDDVSQVQTSTHIEKWPKTLSWKKKEVRKKETRNTRNKESKEKSQKKKENTKGTESQTKM